MPSPSVSESSHVDALFVGTAFLDIVLAELDGPPTAGREVWAAKRVFSPGGMANNAIGAARLGLHSALVTAVGEDSCGDLLWAAMEQEPGLDLSWARRDPGVETALTVAVSADRDRSLISHGALDPLTVAEITQTIPFATTSFASLHPEPVEWLSLLRRAGSIVFAGVGWDENHGWSQGILAQLSDVDVFIANEEEALAYTRASSVQEAMRRLGEHVSLVVVTRGADGALALDAAAGLEVSVDALPGPVRDTTGAGDEFVAGLMHATAAGLPLDDRLRFAALCSGLGVRGWGGSASAPTLSTISSWSRSAEPRPHGYAFLDEFLAVSII